MYYLKKKGCLAFLLYTFVTFLWSLENAVKDVNQIFTSNKLSEKKSEHLFFKKANLWAFEALADFFWNIYGELVGVCQSKKYSPRSNCFLWTVVPGSRSYFLMKPSDTSIINPVFQNKIWVTWKKITALAYLGRVKIS